MRITPAFNHLCCVIEDMTTKKFGCRQVFFFVYIVSCSYGMVNARALLNRKEHINLSSNLCNKLHSDGDERAYTNLQ